MFYIQFRFFSLLLIILFDILFINSQKLPFDTIVSFGDANTDTGNTYNLTNHQWPLVPPYYQGRFTNGPVWIEKLNISKLMNYAYIGATIDNDNLVTGFTGPNNISVPGIRQQIVSYLASNDITQTDLSRTLHVIWAGANDYFDNSSLTADAVVSSLIDAIYDLVSVQVSNILIMNQPPLQSFPAFQVTNNNLTLSRRINEHNNYLLSNVSQIQVDYNTLSIKVFDLYSLLTKILSNNSTFKSNKTGQCWTILNNETVLQCSNPDQYIFIDDYHFTSSIHQFIADNVRQSFTSSSKHFCSSSKLSIFICIIVFITFLYDHL